MAGLGAVPERAPVGHGSRGLQRQRRRVVVLQPRPGAVPRLPVGRGRPRRHQRRQAAALPGARAVERARPDPEGAAVRADERRGQPRRGRQGVLLLRRQPADAQLPALALQVPASRVPVRRPRRHEPGPLATRDGVRADRHRRLRRRRLLRRRGRVRQGRHRTTSLCRITVHNRVRKRRRPPRAADAVVPQHLVVGAHGEPRPRLARVEPRAAPGRPRRPPPSSASGTSTPSPRPPCCSARTRPTRPACSAPSRTTPYPKDGIDDHVVHGARHREPGGTRAPRRPPTSGSRYPPAASACSARAPHPAEADSDRRRSQRPTN